MIDLKFTTIRNILVAGTLLSLLSTAQAAPPTATTLPASEVSNSVASLLGSVNPLGASSTVWFEWGVAPPYRSQASPPVSVGSGSLAVNITNAISINPGLLYRYQVVVSNAAYTVRGLPVAFGSPAVTLSGAATLTNVINTPYNEPGVSAGRATEEKGCLQVDRGVEFVMFVCIVRRLWPGGLRLYSV